MILRLRKQKITCRLKQAEKMIKLKTIHLMLILFATTRVLAQFCPKNCVCNDESLSVKCDNAGLTNIPILLNPRTKSLSLRNNRITSVTADELSFYTNLAYLDASHNQIGAIEPGAFERLTELKILKLNDNSMTFMDQRTFTGLYELLYLDVAHNALERLPTSFLSDCHKLQHLNVSFNAISDISQGAMTGLDQLQIFDAKQNVLTEIPAVSLHTVRRLQELDMSYNRLTRIENDSLAHQSMLEKLRLENNRLESIDTNAFTGLSSLQILSLSDNRLARVPSAALRQLGELHHLDLSANPFDTLSTSCLEGLGRLHTLTINTCPHLQRVELNAFSGLYSLQALTLTGNSQLAQISTGVFERPNVLRRLFLSNNNLRTLSADLLADWSQLDELSLSGNRWQCDCQLVWMRRQMRVVQLVGDTAKCDNLVDGSNVADFSDTCTDNLTMLLNMPVGVRVLLAITGVALVVSLVGQCAHVYTITILSLQISLMCLRRYHDRLFTTCYNCCRRQSSSKTTGTNSSASSVTTRCSPLYTTDDTVLTYENAYGKTTSSRLQYASVDQNTLQRCTLPYRSNIPSSTLRSHQLYNPLTIRTNFAYPYPPGLTTDEPKERQQQLAHSYDQDEPCYASIAINYDDAPLITQQQYRQHVVPPYNMNYEHRPNRTRVSNRPTHLHSSTTNRYHLPSSDL